MSESDAPAATTADATSAPQPQSAHDTSAAAPDTGSNSEPASPIPANAVSVLIDLTRCYQTRTCKHRVWINGRWGLFNARIIETLGREAERWAELLAKPQVRCGWTKSSF